MKDRVTELTRQIEVGLTTLESNLRHLESLFERRKGSPQTPQPLPKAGRKELVLAATA